MQNFILGFEVTGRFLLLIAGGAAAVLLFVVGLLLVGCIAGIVFDLVTDTLARRWEKTGRVPRNKLERIILENHRRGS